MNSAFRIAIRRLIPAALLGACVGMLPAQSAERSPSESIDRALAAFDEGNWQRAVTEIDRANTVAEGRHSKLRDALVAASLYETARQVLDVLESAPVELPEDASSIDPESVRENARVALRESVALGVRSLRAGETDPRVGRNLRRAVELLRSIEPRESKEGENEKDEQAENEPEDDDQQQEQKPQQSGEQQGQESQDPSQSQAGDPQPGDPQPGDPQQQDPQQQDPQQGEAQPREKPEQKESGDPGEGAPEPELGEGPPEPSTGEPKPEEGDAKRKEQPDAVPPDDAKTRQTDENTEKSEGEFKPTDRMPEGTPERQSGSAPQSGGTTEGNRRVPPPAIPIDLRSELERQRLRQILGRLAEQREELRRRRAEASRRGGGRDW